MGKIDDANDIPHSERGERDIKLGFKGFDWWWSWTHIALPLWVSFGRWSGPMGYKNGSWDGWSLNIGFLVFGCHLEWTSKWHPRAPVQENLVPRKRPRRANSPEAIADKAAEDPEYRAAVLAALNVGEGETP